MFSWLTSFQPKRWFLRGFGGLEPLSAPSSSAVAVSFPSSGGGAVGMAYSDNFQTPELRRYTPDV